MYSLPSVNYASLLALFLRDARTRQTFAKEIIEIGPSGFLLLAGRLISSCLVPLPALAVGVRQLGRDLVRSREANLHRLSVLVFGMLLQFRVGLCDLELHGALHALGHLSSSLDPCRHPAILVADPRGAILL